VAGVTPGRAFAATWRNQAGEVVGTTYGGTTCRFPIKPWRLRFHADDFEGVLPCGECPGCLEFYRRRLAARFHAKYGTGAHLESCSDSGQAAYVERGVDRNKAILFAVRIYAPLELHAQYSRRWHRRPAFELEPGFIRCGVTSFFLISREPSALLRELSRIGLRSRKHVILLRRGRRAWRVPSAGLIVSRKVYGEQLNRWYVRGLPKAERQQWEVRKVGKYQTYIGTSSPRAWKGSDLVLVPPEVWKLRRADRRALRGILSRTPDPEGVSRVMRLVAGVIEGRGGERSSGEDRIRSITTGSQHLQTSGSNVIAARGARSGLRHTAAEYRKLAELSSSTATPNLPSGSIPPFSEMGGYVSSEHDQGELLPKQLADADRKAWIEGRKKRALEESLAIIERMRKKTTGEG
jgi:hypothetical protein